MNNDEKIMGVLSYLYIFVLIPIFLGPKTPFVRSHANQGLVLVGIRIIAGLILVFTAWIPIIRWIVILGVNIVKLATLILAIIGIIAAIQGKTIELPIISKIKLIA